MQPASDAYIESMKLPFRNRGYIRGSIGIINSEAQKRATASPDYTGVETAYFSNAYAPFRAEPVTRVYATAEEDFSKIDGSMYFLPAPESGLELYNNGIVSEDLIGEIYIKFLGDALMDIKGLTINFGEYYPTEFTIESDNAQYNYTNDKQLFVTEDVFNESSFIVIRAISMINGEGRLRINKIDFGIVDSFGNDEVISYSSNEFVSPTAETLPSKDVEIVIDNQNSYYNPDNPASAMSYLELGQEVKIAFGYDVKGDGNIEWLPEMLTYLKSWSSSDTEAHFNCADLFEFADGTYYKGEYVSQGISLYDLAEDVFWDAGFESDQYYIDPYLKNIVVYNPMPVVKHSEALQIIANAGRCALYDDRDGRIHLQASFVPDMEATSNNETEYSMVQNVLEEKEKIFYGEASNDFTTVDGTVFFMPEGQNYLQTGYISESVWRCKVQNKLPLRLGKNLKLRNAEGYWDEGTPKITIQLSAGFVSYGFKIVFRNVKPEEFTIATFYEGEQAETMVARPTQLVYETYKRFKLFDKMELVFTKGSPESRIFVDSIVIGDATNYTMSRTDDIEGSPTAIRQERLKKMSIIRTNYLAIEKEDKELVSEDIELKAGLPVEHTVYFREPSYNLSIRLEGKPSSSIMKAEIVNSSNYFATILFSYIDEDQTVRLIVSGREYATEQNTYSKNYHSKGTDVSWSNPLISTVQHAKDLEEWLSSYYLGEVEYQFDWRGDPRVDANDLFYLELKDGRKTMIRAYENNLSFNGGWSGKIKARRVIL